MYSNSLARGQYPSNARFAYFVSLLAILSTLSARNPSSFCCSAASLTLFYRAFLRSNLSTLSCLFTSIEKLGQIARWPDPYSYSYTEHFASSLAIFAVVNIKSIVDMRPASLTTVITPAGSRLCSDSSAMKSMIGALSSWLDVLLTWLPPQSGLCRLKPPAPTTSRNA